MSMILYKIEGNELEEVIQNPFKLEKEIQNCFELHLEKIMKLQIVKSEFTIKNKRIDTLAYDSETNAFVLIEYKRDRNMSVVDQGFTYLSLMLENRADFVLDFNSKFKTNKTRDGIDWSQSKVIFVSPDFTENQIQSTNFKDMGIELWEVKRFDNDTMLVKSIKKTSSAVSIKPLEKKNGELKKIVDQIQPYTEERHFSKLPDNIIELYGMFKSSILNLSDDIEVKALQNYISFNKRNIIAAVFLRRKDILFEIPLRNKSITKEEKNAIDSKGLGVWRDDRYQIRVTNDDDLEYIMSIIKKAIK